MCISDSSLRKLQKSKKFVEKSRKLSFYRKLPVKPCGLCLRINFDVKSTDQVRFLFDEKLVRFRNRSSKILSKMKSLENLMKAHEFRIKLKILETWHIYLLR